MKKSILCSLFVIAALTLLPQTTTAETGYVSDMLLLTFREGPGTNFSVIKTLRSSTPVKVVGEENGFFKVELQSREIGWVDKKFIIFETPKSVIIQGLEREKSVLEQKVARLEARMAELKKQLSASNDDRVKKISDLETRLSQALAEKQELTKSLAANKKSYDTLVAQSKNIQQIVAENQRLKTEHKTLTTEFGTLEKENKSLLRTGMIKWFLAGVGTLLIGWIIGNSVSTKRRSGSSLLD